MNLTLQEIIDKKDAYLAELHHRQGIIRDLVRGVAGEYDTGLYVFGPPGTAKTHTVKAVLEKEIREIYRYQRGHLTPLGLFELIQQHPDEVIVLDDLVTIFRSDVALQILLSALEHPTGHDRGRIVRYQRKGEEQRVVFRGGIICISNRSLHDDELLAAFKSRVHTLKYDPSDGQLGALMLDIADKGCRGVKPEEARAVAHFVIEEMLRLGCRFDLRIFVNKALPDYRQWQDDETESHWKDLVTATIEETLVAPRQEAEPPATRAARIERETRIAREIYEAFPTPAERVEAWQRTTGKSPRAFYRRVGSNSAGGR